jgi:hypothetical protein
LLGQPIQTQLIADHWDDLLRLVASMKFGHTTASLLIAKLHASSRQSTLAKALHEYGRLIRTLYVPLPRRRRPTSPGTPSAQQGRESACATARPVFRASRPRPPTPSR